ncbi:MAG: uracil-DNA glycosylase [Paraperlucidibaca sp.]
MLLPSCWQAQLNAELDQPYMQQLRQFLLAECEAGHRVYPPTQQCFAAFQATPFAKVRVVILGQDPYHGEGQAHGLSFSVPAEQKLPPSLRNIFREISTDLEVPAPLTGDLSLWAAQGVLLLNSVLTVRAGEAASHQKQGWETFTDAAIRALNAHREGVVFLLWGGYAQRKGRLIDRSRHHVLSAVHPSPLAANRGGWFGCRHFSQTNALLVAQQDTPITWA